jgi:crossover junction endodeoxyribonuclease RuvC
MKIKIVGIDPGLAGTGIGIIEGNHHRVENFAFGAITTSAKDPQALRLQKIYNRLCDVFGKEDPDLIVIEDVFFLEKYPKSGIVLGKVSGVVLLACCKTRAAVKEVAVREAKQVLTGNGNATKVQLETAVRKALGYPQPIRPYHASDALGLALIGLFRYGGSHIRCLQS